MDFYWLIPFIAIVVLATCNGAIISSKKKDKIRYSLLLFNSSLFIWACIDILLWVNKLDSETGLLLNKISSISWLSISFLFMNFVYELLFRKRDLYYFSVLFLTVIFIIISLFTNKILVGVEMEYWGIFPKFGDWILIAVTFLISSLVYSLAVIENARKKKKNDKLKRIYKSLILGAVITISIDSIFDVFLPVIFNIKIISLAALGNSILSLFLFVIINKYHFLELGIEEISKNIFDKVSEGVILTSAEGEILMMNRSANLLQLKSNKIIYDIIEPNNNKDSIIKSKVLDSLTGESTYLNISSNTIIDDTKGELHLYLLNDVSELVKFKNSLQDKIEENQITLYRIGHDIKGPASAIKQLVFLSKTDKENVDVYLEKIEISINQLIRFIYEVETVIRTKESSLVSEDVDLNSILNRCWEELTFFRQKDKHKLELNLNAPIVKSDATMIYSIVLNVLSNAIKYNDISNKGENIIKVSSALKNNLLEIEISDNGVGMDEETANNVYKLFYRGTTKIAGVGLGMYIVKHATEKLNGSISVTSKPSVGSCFTIKIPVVK